MGSKTERGNQPKKSRLGLALGAILVGVFVATAGAATLLLLLPPLLAPPLTQAPAYDMFSSGEVSTEVGPERDRLLVSEDGRVALYVPAGATRGIGTLILQPREPELIPMRKEGSVERIRAVDILMLDVNGEILSSTTFDPELLLCFRLTDDLQKAREADSRSVMIQRFDERPEKLNWEDLSVGPGWDSDQACASLNYPSILALAVDQRLKFGGLNEGTPSGNGDPYSLPRGIDGQ